MAAPESVVSGSPASRGNQLGQTEIENLGVAAISDENIRGLDVAMNDAFGVRGVEGIGDFDGKDRAIGRSRSSGLLERCFSVWPFEKLHGDERRPFCSPISWMVQMFG